MPNINEVALLILVINRKRMEVEFIAMRLRPPDNDNKFRPISCN